MKNMIVDLYNGLAQIAVEIGLSLSHIKTIYTMTVSALMDEFKKSWSFHRKQDNKHQLHRFDDCTGIFKVGLGILVFLRQHCLK